MSRLSCNQGPSVSRVWAVWVAGYLGAPGCLVTAPWLQLIASGITREEWASVSVSSGPGINSGVLRKLHRKTSVNVSVSEENCDFMNTSMRCYERTCNVMLWCNLWPWQCLTSSRWRGGKSVSQSPSSVLTFLTEPSSKSQVGVKQIFVYCWS